MYALQELMNRYYYITLLVSILVCTFAIPLVYLTLKLLLTSLGLIGGLFFKTLQNIIKRLKRKG